MTILTAPLIEVGLEIALGAWKSFSGLLQGNPLLGKELAQVAIGGFL